MSRDELHRTTLAEFGIRRLTDAAAVRLDEALELGRVEGRLAADDGIIRPVR